MLQTQDLLDDQERAERLSRVDRVLRDGAGLVQVALSDQRRGKCELPEGPAACPVSRPPSDGGLGLAPRFIRSELGFRAG
jgi:hypothetical protein